MINASHHANEWLTSLIVMMFVENYLETYYTHEIYKGYNIREIWNKTSIYIIPMVNPDGVNLVLKENKILNNDKYKNIWEQHIDNIENWKANIRGVDINVNYPTGWEEARKNKYKKGISSPGPRDFVGANPASEIETLNMINFTKLHKFDLTISLHSQGKEIYWSYQDKKDNKALEIGQKFSKISGYTLTEPVYNSSFAGYKDWYIDTFNKRGFTIEMGEGEEGKPLKLSQAQEIYNELEEVFFLGAQSVCDD